MHELLKIKVILEAQISTTKEMIENDKANLKESSIYLKTHIRELKIKIEAWEQTLKYVNKEIEYTERLLEELEIFKANTHETYYG
ncbi:hypothetical protein GCM10008904_30980 [Paraclostridium ghonii]|uniref:Septal ring factor EnvC (AmiA/AmiB activator) n=1 Tax=Paraclostridium ghonii TaxID=29358 RepID=A0ABU0MYC3_9FIRM|nr:hypothetical protein [Paeniclostridium ghonii]MDQ0555501.1 septal ring factor EnvC (AmiA/AmiB activator) [Paeniclostridium ghonii]